MSAADGRVIGSTQILNNGPATRRYNLVIASEGYRDSEMSVFAADAQELVQTLLRTSPFDQLQSALNVFRVDVASTESGADDPAACGGTGATPRTYFDATFCTNKIRRLLVVDDSLVIQVVGAQVPQWHMIWVMVNSPVYGGSGGSVATLSKATGAMEIALHEMGHTAFHLADEYEYYAGCGEETDHDHHPAAEPMEPNVTTNANRSSIKWGSLIAASTAVPTTRNADCSQCDPQASPVPVGTVGAFEGAHYYHCGCYRPAYDCRMRALGHPFCGVCESVIRNRIAPFMPAPVPGLLSHDEVAIAAYHLWEQDGGGHGRDLEHWFQATRQVWDQRFGIS